MEIGLPGACELARHGLNNVVSICKSQIPEALEMTSMLLRAHGDAVIAGLAPSTLPRSDFSAGASSGAPAKGAAFYVPAYRRQPACLSRLRSGVTP
jgi:hypothetical protein